LWQNTPNWWRSSAKAMDSAKPENQVLTVYCHNVLADAWVQYGGEKFYDRGLLDSGLLDAAARRKLFFRLAAESKADIICLQEIGLSEAAALSASELSAAYHITGLAENAVTSAPEPNGVVVLLRRGVMDPSYETSVVQLGGSTVMGLVKCRRLKGFPHRVIVVNTHLDWGEEGVEQGRGVLKALRGQRGFDGAAIIWCGDFNKTPDDPFFEEVRAAGFGDGLDFRPELGSCGCTEKKERLDYALYRGPIVPASEDVCPEGFSAGRSLSATSLLGKFADLADLLRQTGSDHVPLAVAFHAKGSQGRDQSRELRSTKGKGRGRQNGPPKKQWRPVAKSEGGGAAD